MIFTDCPLDHNRQKLYYRVAFQPSNFATLTYRERMRLIEFTVGLLDANAVVLFIDTVEHSLGRYDRNKDILYVNKALLQNPDSNLYAYELYSFLYRSLFQGMYAQRTTIEKRKGKLAAKVNRYRNETEKREKTISYTVLLEELKNLRDYYEMIMLHTELLIAYLAEISRNLSREGENYAEEMISVAINGEMGQEANIGRRR